MLEDLREKLRRSQQDKDIEDRDGTQPKKYYAKDADGDEMSKSTKQDRARHFEKGTKKDDDDPSAYEPAPGDAQAKTKPSQHTKKFKKMFEDAAVDAANLKAKHAEEQERLKAKHEQEVEALKDRQEREMSRVDAQKEKEAQDKQIQAKRDAERKAAEKQQQKEELEEGKYVAGVSEILSTLTSKFKKEAGERYQKNSERGLAFINQLAKMVGASVTDKKQQKGKLFMKNEYEPLEEKVDIKKALKRVKGLTKDQLAVLSAMNPSTLVTIMNQLSNLAMGEKLDPKKDDVGDYVDDFKKSDAPQFKGKSDEKIRKMAVAAYLDAKGK